MNMRSMKDLISKNRSIRRFKENNTISIENLRKLIDLGRLSPSAANKQPLKYILSNNSERNNIIFKYLAWAGYLTNWKGPDKGERPAAYIIICADKSIDKGSIDCDHGIAAQSILLGAVELGYGGCIIGSINRDGLQKDLTIPDEFRILLVLALGVPDEEIILDPMDERHGIKYWRDEKDIHHVPKRSLGEVIYELK